MTNSAYADHSHSSPALPRQLIYLAYGQREDILLEARFSILSALARKGQDELHIVVLTESATTFRDLPVEILNIEPDTLKTWFGTIRYHHRSKPCALLSVMERAEKSILVDTDTFFLKSPLHLFDLIDEQHVLVDRLLNPMWTKRDQYAVRCGGYLRNHYRVHSRHRHVNSGLIGLTRGHAAVIRDMIEIIDGIYEMSGKLLHTEQVALGIAITHHGLTPVAHKSVLQHYYAKKYAYRAVAAVFLRDHPDALSPATLAQLRHFRLERPNPPPLQRFKYKLLSLKLPKPGNVRDAYLELAIATHAIHNTDPYIVDQLVIHALNRIREMSADLFLRIKQQGAAQVFGAALSDQAAIELIDLRARKLA